MTVRDATFSITDQRRFKTRKGFVYLCLIWRNEDIRCYEEGAVLRGRDNIVRLIPHPHNKTKLSHILSTKQTSSHKMTTKQTSSHKMTTKQTLSHIMTTKQKNKQSTSCDNKTKHYPTLLNKTNIISQYDYETNIITFQGIMTEKSHPTPWK